MRLLATIALLASACTAPSPRPASDRAAKLRAVLERFRAESKFPGAVAGAWFADDGTTTTVAVGLADRDRRTPMPEGALLHAGSIGKTLFAALVLQLVGEQRIGLDDRASRFLGGEPWYAGVPNGDAITVRMLLEHTSGLPGWSSEFMTALAAEPGRVRPPVEAVRSIVGQPAAFPAGSKFGYSDVNYQLLQLIAERVTGRSAYDEIRDRLLAPNGLAQIVPADRKQLPGLVPGYAGEQFFLGFDAVLGDDGLRLDPTFEGGGGGFVTNAGDLARWMPLFAEAKVYPAALRDDVRRGVPAGQLDIGKDARSGLGIELAPTPLGVAYGHGGFFPGYLSLALWYPDAGVSLAIQANSSAQDALGRPLRDVMHDAARALAGR